MTLHRYVPRFDHSISLAILARFVKVNDSTPAPFGRFLFRTASDDVRDPRAATGARSEFDFYVPFRPYAPRGALSQEPSPRGWASTCVRFARNVTCRCWAITTPCRAPAVARSASTCRRCWAPRRRHRPESQHQAASTAAGRESEHLRGPKRPIRSSTSTATLNSCGRSPAARSRNSASTSSPRAPSYS